MPVPEVWIRNAGRPLETRVTRPAVSAVAEGSWSQSAKSGGCC